MLLLKKITAIFMICAVILTSCFIVSAENISVDMSPFGEVSQGNVYDICTSDNYIFALTGESRALSYEIKVYDKENSRDKGHHHRRRQKV